MPLRARTSESWCEVGEGDLGVEQVEDAADLGIERRPEVRQEAVDARAGDDLLLGVGAGSGRDQDRFTP